MLRVVPAQLGETTGPPDTRHRLRRDYVRCEWATIHCELRSRRREADADLLAIEMCIDAGYDPERCIAALEHLVNVSFDYGDVDSVLGPETGRSWSWHPPRAQRIAAVRGHAVAAQRGVRRPLDVTLRRERQRRRRALAVAGAGAAAVCALLILRRPPPGWG